MKIIKTPDEMRSHSRNWRSRGLKVGFVPTMGYFHEGHLALMDEAARLSDRVVVSLFVNPAQFGPSEDFNKYPRDTKRDISLAELRGVACLFMPEKADIYLPGHQTWVEVTEISKGLCGRTRPGHFRGVATVVAKLFNIVEPDIAVFGEKDFQQLQVIRQMVRDLNFPVEIHGYPIVREDDGLAMSSRNSYLSESERNDALCLSMAIQKCRELLSQGLANRREVVKKLRDFITQTPSARIDYIFLGDPETLNEPEEIPNPALIALAVYIGNTRLIDNAIIDR